MGRYVVMMKKRVKFGFGSFRSRSLRNATCTMNVSLPSELFINPSIVDIKNFYLYRTSHVIVFDVMTIYRYELKIITYVPSAVLDIPVFFSTGAVRSVNHSIDEIYYCFYYSVIKLFALAKKDQI